MTAFEADQQTGPPAPVAETALHAPQSEGFPPGFRWGAATSAYQIEGATALDGRGPGVWDTMCATPGRILGGDTAEEAIDHYHRFREDVAVMADMGITSYRFSVSWPRIQPAGSGPVNQAGLDFYRRLVEELLDKGIEPWLTLYHWDLPQHLEDLGGWPERDTAHRFAEFAALTHDALGDRVENWMTVNEPWCAAYLGYASGDHAPGRQEPAAALRAAHHLLLGHGLAVEAIRGQGRDTRIGPAVNLYAISPATDAPEDLDAARRIDGLQNRFFLDAILLGRYPEDLLEDLAPLDFAACVKDGDLEIISRPVDLVGINYYTRHTVSGLPGDNAQAASSPFSVTSPWVGSDHVRFLGQGKPVTGMGWEIDPDGLHEVLTQVHRDYPPVPLYITENGAGYDEVLDDQGGVQDTERIAYIDAHLRACQTAIAEGIPLKGYFTWSLMDNFEWAWGYTKRFGLVYVDYATQRRTPKASANWYAQVIRQGGLPEQT